MAARVTIGEFSTMTRLSRKALRYYHDLGLRLASGATVSGRLQATDRGPVC